MRKVFKIIGIAVLVVIIFAGIFIATYQPKQYSDYGVYSDLRNFTMSLMQEYKISPRPISPDFKNFIIDLGFPYSKLFGGSKLGIPLVTYESDRIAAATISQFEVPPQSGYYRDFTFNLRTHYPYKAPIFHIDFMKPSPGLPGLCSMDFFNADPETIDLDIFLGPEIEQVEKAMALVEKYQRTAEQGRGKITAYMDHCKSKYRMELQAPDAVDEQATKEYYEAVAEAYKLAVTAYLKRLYSLGPDLNYAQRHETKVREFVQALYDNDFAVKMGRKIFKDKFKKYWMDGFWAVQLETKSD